MTGSVTFHAAADDGVARVVLAHPGKLNAIDIAMWRELRTLFDALQALPPAEALRAIVVCGVGGQFASGGDIVEFASFRFIESRLHEFHEQIVAPALHAMLNCDIPLFAQIDGACIGGGFEIAMRRARCSWGWCTRSSSMPRSKHRRCNAHATWRACRRKPPASTSARCGKSPRAGRAPRSAVRTSRTPTAPSTAKA